MNLHSEVLRYSSSASTIRPAIIRIPFYDDIRIRVYDFTSTIIITHVALINVTVVITILRGDEIYVRAVTKNLIPTYIK